MTTKIQNNMAIFIVILYKIYLFMEIQIDLLIKQYSHLIPDYIDLAKLRQQGEGIYKRLQNGSEYYGQMLNGKRHGQEGILINGQAMYAGEWQNDLKYGRGYERFANGCSFDGTYINGKQDGQGIYTWADGATYNGQWSNGMKHGQGAWRSGNGRSSYSGIWCLGQAEGKGQQVSENGDHYEGEFKKGVKHGNGKEHFSNGDFYEGQYLNGLPEGYGVYIWRSGAIYEGQLKNGLRHGQGHWRENINEAGSSYQGEYVNDMKSGFGTFRWISGNVYKGQFFEDKRQGYGEMYWTDGSYYKGQWHQGVQNGEGELFTKVKGVQKGLFIKNRLISQQTIDDEKRYQNHPPAFKVPNYQLKNEFYMEPSAAYYSSGTQTSPVPNINENNHVKVPKMTIIQKTLIKQNVRRFQTQEDENTSKLASFFIRNHISLQSDSQEPRSKSVSHSRGQYNKVAQQMQLSTRASPARRTRVWLPSGIYRPKN